jgi:hypothetical protein
MQVTAAVEVQASAKGTSATVAGSAAFAIDNVIRTLLQDEHSAPWLLIVQ